MNNSIPDISVVVPLYDEEESLQELYRRITDVSQNNNLKYEIIFIDDGSKDRSFEILKSIARDDKNVRVYQFQRNFGKSAALAHGFKETTGKYVITMDADLQDDPDEIPNLIKKLEEGYDVVSGWKKKRHDPISKRLPSKFFNFITSVITGIKIHDFNCGLKIYRSEVIKSIKVYGSLHRYIPALAKANGFSVSEIEVKHHPRKYGTTKFGFSRSLGMFDLITIVYLARFMTRPLHFFGLLGFLFFGAGFLINLYLSVIWFMGTGIGQRPLFFLGILLIIIGIQFGSIGLLGEMVTHLRIEKYNYQLKNRLNHPEENII